MMFVLVTPLYGFGPDFRAAEAVFKAGGSEGERYFPTCITENVSCADSTPEVFARELKECRKVNKTPDYGRDLHPG